MEKGGAWNVGKPAGTSPISLKGTIDELKENPIAPQMITRIALRAVPTSQRVLLMILCLEDLSSSSAGPICQKKLLDASSFELKIF